MAENSAMDTPSAVKKEWRTQERAEPIIDKRLRIETRFGLHVRMYRRRRQLTQAELAYLCDVHQNYISDIESGKRNVTLRVVETLAKALGVQAKDLVV